MSDLLRRTSLTLAGSSCLVAFAGFIYAWITAQLPPSWFGVVAMAPLLLGTAIMFVADYLDDAAFRNRT